MLFVWAFSKGVGVGFVENCLYLNDPGVGVGFVENCLYLNDPGVFSGLFKMEGFRHFWRSKLNPVLLMITEGNPRFGVEIWAFRGRMRWWFLGFRKVQAKLCSHTPFSLGVEIWGLHFEFILWAFQFVKVKL